MFTNIVLFIAMVVFVIMVLETWFPDNEKMMVERLEGFKVYSASEKQIQMNLPLYERIYKSIENVLIRYFGEQMSKGKGFAPLRLKLYQAGLDIDPIQHRTKRIILALLFGGLSMLSYNYRLVVIVTVIGLIFPDYQLRKRIDERRFQIKEELPDFCDLLAAVFPGCNGFEDAVNRICAKYDTIISREFQRAMDEINAGVSKKEALRALATRCGISQIDTLVAQIIQTEMLGTEMAETLKIQAKKMRELKKQNAEIKARRANLTLLLPSVFLLVSILIVIAGPSVLQFMQAMSAF